MDGEVKSARGPQSARRERWRSFTVALAAAIAVLATIVSSVQEPAELDGPRSWLFDPIEEHAFYTSYSKTFTPVGGELIGITPGDKNNNLDPQHTRLYEGGVKSDWLNGRLATTLSLYRLEMYNKRSKD